MKAVTAKSRVSLAQGDLVDTDPAYANRFSLYGVVPSETVSLSEFERFGEERLNALREVDVATSTGQKGETFK
jgi:hypothetical protein